MSAAFFFTHAAHPLFPAVSAFCTYTISLGLTDSVGVHAFSPPPVYVWRTKHGWPGKGGRGGAVAEGGGGKKEEEENKDEEEEEKE